MSPRSPRVRSGASISSRRWSLTALIAKRDPKRHQRFAARWLWRYLGES
jgi:hypothetical protein